MTLELPAARPCASFLISSSKTAELWHAGLYVSSPRARASGVGDFREIAAGFLLDTTAKEGRNSA